MLSDGTVTDFEDVPLRDGDIVLALVSGRMIRARILQTRMPTLLGATLVQSLVDPRRTCVIDAAHCALVERPEVKP